MAARKKKTELPALWMTLNIKSAVWPVMMTNDPSHFQGDGDEGCCDYEAGIIYIASWLSDTQRPNVLLHEVLHAIVYSMGVGQLMQLLVDAKDHDEREERLVSLLAIDLYDTLQRNGLLVLPKAPKLSEDSRQKRTK